MALIPVDIDLDAMTPGADPNALGPETVLLGTNELVCYLLDVLSRKIDDYRAKDLPTPALLSYGTPPWAPIAFPHIAVSPASWEREDLASNVRGKHGSPTEKTDQLVVRVYHEIVETESENAFPEVTRTIDYLAALILENQTLRGKDGCKRVFQAWPARAFIQTFIEEGRGGQLVAIRGAELEVEVQFTHERVTVDDNETGTVGVQNLP